MHQINMWQNDVDQSGFDVNGYTYVNGLANPDFGFDTFDNTSQQDFSTTSSYAQSSAAPSEHDYSHTRRPKPGHYSARAPKASRRESTQSVAQSQGQYADSGFYSATMSPTVDMTSDFFSYPQNSHDFNQDFTMYDSSSIDDMFDFAVPDLESSVEQLRPDSPMMSDGETSGSSNGSSAPARNHPLYNAAPADDGLYYCPFDQTEGCGHEPRQLKCEYEYVSHSVPFPTLLTQYSKYIDSHLKPFRCRHAKCADLQFSSTACLLRHEREAHEMHGHEESLCEYPPCNRATPGNGFRRSYNCKDHMTRCHGWIDHNPQDSKKRRSGSSSAMKVNKVKSSTKVLSKKQQIAQLKDEWAKRKANLEELTHSLAPDGPLFAIALTQINNEMQTLKSIQVEWSKLTGRTHIG
jgi:hypothetical protein